MPERESHRTTASGARNADVAMRFADPIAREWPTPTFRSPTIACPIRIRLDHAIP